MDARLALCALVFVMGISGAQVTSTRVTPFDFQCQDTNGARISDHQRFDTAFVACLNAPNGVYVQGGRYKIGKTVADPAGAATISWTAPTQNTDGSPLTDLSGYRIVYGQSPTALSGAVDVGKVNTHTLTGLTPGVWYVVVISLTPTRQSLPSNAVSKTVS